MGKTPVGLCAQPRFPRSSLLRVCARIGVMKAPEFWSRGPPSELFGYGFQVGFDTVNLPFDGPYLYSVVGN